MLDEAGDAELLCNLFRGLCNSCCPLVILRVLRRVRGGHVLTNRAAEHSVNPFITAAASGTSSEPVAPLQPVGVAGEEHVRRGCGSFSCGDHLYFAAWLDWLRNRALGWR